MNPCLKANIRRLLKDTLRLMLACCFVVLAICDGAAQSNDANAPTPLREPVIEGRISPLDVGDARLTRHYYVFTGLPGDLEIALTSDNLNGDVDVFTFDGLRPLSKLTLFAGGEPLSINKTIFLREAEILLLRVEARSIGDAEGRYRITFGGAFALAPEAMLAAQPAEETTNVESTASTGRRVTSVGGRIAPEETAATEPAPDVAPTLPEVEVNDAPSTRTVDPPRARGRRRNPARTTARTTRRPPRPPRVRRSPPSTTPTTPPSETASTDTNESPVSSGEASPVVPPSEPAQITESSPAVPQFKLIVETVDGQRLERAMSGVRRVTITNGELVILLSTGRVERLSMKTVTRIAVEP